MGVTKMPQKSLPKLQGELTDTWGRRNRKHADKNCAQCGSTFRPRRADSSYCSVPCARAKNGGQSECTKCAHLQEINADLLAACQEFVRKVEAGEARSTRSYEQMKAAIAKAAGGE